MADDVALPDNWGKRARHAARGVADQHGLTRGAQRAVRQAIYAELAAAHGNLPGALDRARRDGLAEAWRLVANLPPGATAVDAARALSTAQEAVHA